VDTIKGLLNLRFGGSGNINIQKALFVYHNFLEQESDESESFVSNILDSLTKYYKGRLCFIPTVTYYMYP
jgi:hypothetical protein